MTEKSIAFVVCIVLYDGERKRHFERHNQVQPNVVLVLPFFLFLFVLSCFVLLKHRE